MTCIERLTGIDSWYGIKASTYMNKVAQSRELIPRLHGVLMALRTDVESGFLNTYQESVHESVFSDFLDTAGYLLSEAQRGFKDAAAVLIGGTLEQHLRNLSRKHGLDTETQSASGTRPKRAEQMNTDLYKASVYGLLDQKSVTTWLDLRNKAAHAEYEKYAKEQVSLMLQGVRDFVSRNPA
jgi:hypothetical protein